MQVPAPVIWMFQQIVDTALTMDPAVRVQLDSLDQKIIEINETGFGFSIYLLVVDRTVEILGYHDGEVDTAVRGNAAALLSLSRETKGLFTGEIELSGDLEVGRSVRELIASLDIDWEEQLSLVTGDSIAHQMGRLHHRLFAAISRTGTDLQQDTGEFLTEETKILATPDAISGYLNKVDDLRDAVERLEAKIDFLENTLGRD